MRVARPAWLDDEPLDANVLVTRDYFWMLRSGVLGPHTRSGWSSFEDGYATMDMEYPPHNSDGVAPPPPSVTASRIDSIRLDAPR